MTMGDILCPKCNSHNWYEWSTDEIGFEFDGTGHYRFLIHCEDCKQDSVITMNFEYKITDCVNGVKR